MSTVAGTDRDVELSTADTGPLSVPAVKSRNRSISDTGGPGTTTIEDAVVEKIASRAVGEVEHVGGAAPRVMGIASAPTRPIAVPRSPRGWTARSSPSTCVCR